MYSCSVVPSQTTSKLLPGRKERWLRAGRRWRFLVLLGISNDLDFARAKRPGRPAKISRDGNAPITADQIALFKVLSLSRLIIREWEKASRSLS